MFGNKAQMQNMLKKARKMQEDLQKKQEELKQQTVDVSVGGGAIALTLNGDKQVVSLKIAKDAIDPGRSGNARRPHHHRFQRSQQEGG